VPALSEVEGLSRLPALLDEAGFGLFKPFPRQNKKPHMGQSLGEGRGLEAAALTVRNLKVTLD